MRPNLIALFVLLSSVTLTSAAPEIVEFSGAFLVALEGAPDKLHGFASPPLRHLRPAIEPLELQELFTVPVNEGPEEMMRTTRVRRPTTRAWLRTPQARLPEAYIAGTGASLKQNPWDLAHAIVDGDVGEPLRPLSDRLQAARTRGFTVAAFEPDVIYADPEVDDLYRRLAAQEHKDCRGAAGDVEVGSCPDVLWKDGKALAWHLARSELSTALKAVGGGDIVSPVTIAHLDTGYAPCVTTASPPRLDREASLDFVPATSRDDPPKRGACDCCGPAVISNCGHGTATLSILAGGWTYFSDSEGRVFDQFLGGAPGARVIEYRISNSVVHVWPWRMAWAIKTAADNAAHVLSMSMGGGTNGALRDAVNYAYEHGTALFTASGNYFQTPLLPLRSPTTVVYPARFNRVVAVVGVTADDTTYKRLPNCWSRLLHPRWVFMGGNAGPSWVMRDEAIGAFTPNITWLRTSEKCNPLDNAACAATPDGCNPAQQPGKCTPAVVDLDGRGTSAATPQAAAAAALWMQMHWDDVRKHVGSWRLPEMTYRALLETADRDAPKPKYDVRLFGEGILRAAKALKDGPLTVPDTPRKEARLPLDWLARLLVDAAPGSVPPPDANRRMLHGEMLVTELAQLLYVSARMQDAVGEHELDGDVDAAGEQRILEAVRDEPVTSQYLRDRVVSLVAAGRQHQR